MKFIFGSFERELDNTDVGVVKKYEKCLEGFYCSVAKINMKNSASEIYSEICNAGKEMAEEFFGEGSAREMFGEAESVRSIMKAICALNKYMNDVGGVIEELRDLGA